MTPCRGCALSMLRTMALGRLLYDVEQIAAQQHWHTPDRLPEYPPEGDFEVLIARGVPTSRNCLGCWQSVRRADELIHLLGDVERLARSQDWRLAQIMSRAVAAPTVAEIEAMFSDYGLHESDRAYSPPMPRRRVTAP